MVYASRHLGLPATPTVNARAELKRYNDAGFFTWAADDYPPLSFDRPEPFNHIDFAERITDPIEGRQACHLAPAEWRLHGWLERQGFEYDLYAEHHLHDGTLDLSAYRMPGGGRRPHSTLALGADRRIAYLRGIGRDHLGTKSRQTIRAGNHIL